MNILYDSQIFNWQSYGGISKYHVRLAERLSEMAETSVKIPIFYSNNKYLLESKFAPFLPTIERLKLPKSESIYYRLGKINNLLCKRAIRRKHFDVFHPTYYDNYFLDYIGNKPFVLTVYDLIHEKYGYLFGKNDKTASKKKLLIEKASKIIAISNNTKKDLVEIYKVDPDKITTIYLAHSNSLADADISNLPKRYILYIGDRWGYKNFPTFIKSISNVLQKDPELYVVLGGGKPLSLEEIEMINRLSIKSRIYHYPQISEAQIGALYRNALVFVFPSKYEGFGIPILEAYNYRCPLIVSDSGSLPEVAGNACIYIDPDDELSITNAIEKIVYDPSLRNSLIEKGAIRAREFSWGKTALETRKVYESVI